MRRGCHERCDDVVFGNIYGIEAYINHGYGDVSYRRYLGTF